MFFALIVVFTGIFLLEGIGFTRQQEVFSLVYSLVSLLLAIFLWKKKAVVPPLFSVLYIVFLIFSLISGLNFSLDKEVSFYWWLFYLSCFLVFIFFYNFKEDGKKIVDKIIIYLVPLFAGLYLLKSKYSELLPFQKIALNENNLFFAYNALHNHLGVIVGLFLIFLIWKFAQNGKKKGVILILLFLPFLLLSYNRSAILAFLIVLIPLVVVFLRKKIKLGLFFILFLFIGGLFFLMVISGHDKKMIKNIELQTKGVLGSRELYWDQAGQSVLEKPFFGVGYGNFGYVSHKYEQGYDHWIDNAANIFLEILTGGGILSFLPFLIVIGLVFSRAVKDKSIYSLLFFFLLIDFQTDFSYRNYSLFVLFIILAAITYQEKQDEEGNKIFFGLVAVLGTLLALVITSNNLLLAGRFEWAQKIFPLNRRVYPALIKKQLKENHYPEAIASEKTFGFIAPFYYPRLVASGSLYEFLGEKEKALEYYKQICEVNKYCSLQWIKKTAQLTNQAYGEEEAYKYLSRIVGVYKNTNTSVELERKIETEIKAICLELTDKKECHFLNIEDLKYFYEPEANLIQKEEEKGFSKVKYTINKDALNERFNYPVKKEKGVYRIMTLGDSLTYGLLVNTDQNWTELLEDKLNKDLKCKNIKKIEVINLGVDGYDIEYTVERYKIRGEKYNPDLIIWPIRSFYKINELRKRKIKSLQENNKEFLTYNEIWERANDEVIDELGREVVRQKQKTYIDQLTKVANKKIIFVDVGEIDENTKLILPKGAVVYNVFAPEDQFYPETGILNKKGNQFFAKKIYEYLLEGLVIHCQK